MSWRFTPYIFPVVIAGVISAGLALYAWRRRLMAGVAAFSILMLAVAVWTLGYALELAGGDIPTKIFWLGIEYLGIVIVPVAWLALALQYTGRTKWLTPRILVLLSIEPLITLVLVWTNDIHHLIHAKVGLEISSAFTVLVITRGTWYWINVVYSFLLLLLGTALIVSFIPTLRRSASVYRGQVSALCIAVLVPWVSNAVTDFGLSPLPNLDLTPLAFTITGIAMAWSLFRFRLLDITPVARYTVVESMSDAVIVLDQRNRITDLNPAAQGILGRRLSALVGQPFAEVASHWPEQVERYSGVMEAHEEMVLTVSEMPRSFDLRISPLYHRSGSFIGRLIVLRDTTEQKRLVEAMQASEVRKGAILQTALDAIITMDHHGNVLEFNPAAEQMFGYNRAEILNQELAAFIVPLSLREQHRRGLARYLATGESSVIGQRIEITALHADGTEFPIELAITRIPLDGPPMFTGYIRDIRERKRALESLEQAREEQAASSRENARLYREAD